MSNETPAGGAVWKNPGIRDRFHRRTENSPRNSAFHVILLTEISTSPIPPARKTLIKPARRAQFPLSHGRPGARPARKTPSMRTGPGQTRRPAPFPATPAANSPRCKGVQIPSPRAREGGPLQRRSYSTLLERLLREIRRISRHRAPEMTLPTRAQERSGRRRRGHAPFFQYSRGIIDRIGTPR